MKLLVRDAAFSITANYEIGEHTEIKKCAKRKLKLEKYVSNSLYKYKWDKIRIQFIY